MFGEGQRYWRSRWCREYNLVGPVYIQEKELGIWIEYYSIAASFSKSSTLFCYNQTHAGQDQGHNIIPEPRTSASNCWWSAHNIGTSQTDLVALNWALWWRQVQYVGFVWRAAHWTGCPKSIGNLLQKSGWKGALAEAGVVFMAAASIARIRQIHQITACSFYKLIKEAYTDYCAD